MRAKDPEGHTPYSGWLGLQSSPVEGRKKGKRGMKGGRKEGHEGIGVGGGG